MSLLINPYRFGTSGGNPAQQFTAMTGSMNPNAPYQTYVPANMVDNNDATVCMFGNPQSAGTWFKVDIGSVKTVAEVEVRQGWNSTTDANCFGAPVLEYSTDDATWTQIHSQATKHPQIIHKTGLSVVARYLRLRETGDTGTNWPCVQEFRVWGYDAP